MPTDIREHLNEAILIILGNYSTRDKIDIDGMFL